MNLFSTKKIVNILLISFSLTFISGCLKKEIDPLTTDLQINIKYKDRYGNLDSTGSLANVTVVLYKSRADMESRNRPVKQGTTDQSGTVLFTNLEPFIYFIHAYYDNEVGYYDNGQNNNSTGDLLVEGALTVATIPIFYQRVSEPSSFRCEYATVLKYDTLWYSGCTKELRLKIANYYGTGGQDSTRWADKYVYPSYDFSFCPKSENSAKYYFTGNLISALSYYYVHIGEEYGSEDSFNYGYSVTNVYPAFFYGYNYRKGNTYGYPEYPRRIRIWEDGKRTIDINVKWE